ncbi:hypothetical protein QYE76_051112 [Lolium multiflorum]|uniref:LOB domain-containing protein n=1 Tax=Lolium multiflorum TaxID=4521 RepID=A0AAD8SR98_LOLMU|nr:hypothetical protein QYE76_051112 [Lolium multiflorum]
MEGKYSGCGASTDSSDGVDKGTPTETATPTSDTVVPVTENISEGAVQSLLELGYGEWDRDEVVSALRAAKNVKVTALENLQLMKSPSSSFNSNDHQNKGTPTETATPTSDTVVPVTENISEGAVQSLLELGYGEWDRDEVVSALRAAKNVMVTALQNLQSKKPHRSSFNSNDHQTKDKDSGCGASADSSDGVDKGTPSETATPISDTVVLVSENTTIPGVPGPAAITTTTLTPRKAKRKNASDSPVSAASPVNNCAKCKKHKKGCHEGCVFAPYFTVDRSVEFELAFEVFGVNKIEKLLKKVAPEERALVHRSLVFESSAWTDNPVRGPLGIVEGLRLQIEALKERLARQQELLNQQHADAASSVEVQQQHQADGAPAAEELQQADSAPAAAEEDRAPQA